jgi:hypothetical protein
VVSTGSTDETTGSTDETTGSTDETTRLDHPDEGRDTLERTP